ncbi:SusC/RagA family TonB-linked outer membrane protein [Compostibacter hankyongensis]|uniref:TonB-dependent receptor n=1 Tax=Compostibacter hankyongensis TaxID=1007089 RepID=A0ABP8FT56_9BACT
MKQHYPSIKRLIAALLFLGGSVTCFAQQAITVRGRVLDKQNGSPLPGVSINDVTSKKALGLTDDRGNFQVITESGHQLKFRYIGYDDQVAQAGEAALRILMTSTSKALKEAVIVGYNARTKETVTGAVSVISGKDIQDVPVSNVEQLLQGKVAGLNIQNLTGAPGFSGSVSIRGISQLNISGGGDQATLASNNPLLVIDNVPIDYDGGIDQSMLQPGAATGPLALIPPDDIESIEVFKDAQAASLYGSRGANGVIVITTKRGNSPTPVITVNSNVFINFPPELRPTWGGLFERRFRVNSILENSRDLIDSRNKLNNAQFLTDSLNPFYNNSTNWQGYFYQTTINTNHNVQISGGDARLNYKTNLAYQLNQGVIKNTGFNKYSLNMQLNFQPDQRLRVGAQLFGALGQKARGNGGGLTNNGAGNAFSSSLNPSPSHFIGIPELEGYDNNLDDNNTVNLRGYLSADYELIPNLWLSSTTSYDYYTDTRDQFKQAFTNNDLTMLYGYLGRRDELNTRNGVNYSYSTVPTNMEQGHNLYVSFFNEVNIKTNKINIVDLRNGPSDYYWGPRGYSPRFYPGNPFNDPNGKNDNGVHATSVYHALSWAGIVSYNYKTKYNIDLSYRLDGNSDAGVSDRYSVNPAIGLRWNFNKERWLRDLTWLDYGSLRMTYGINSRATSTILNTLGVYQIYADYNNAPSVAPEFSVLPNPTLQPEKSYQYDIGADLGLFKGRLTFTYDTYYKRTYNIVRSFYLPDITGYNEVQVNGGSLVNYGHELAVTARLFNPLQPGAFHWTVSLNGALNRGTLTGLPGGITLYRQIDPVYAEDFILKVGRNPISNYLYQNTGIYQSTADVPVDPIRGVRAKWQAGGTNFFQAGDPIWTDVNGDYAISGNHDKFVIGNPDPLMTGGMSNTFSYHNFSLNIYCSYLIKRTLLNNALSTRLQQLSDPDKMSNVYDLDQLRYWTGAGSDASYSDIMNVYHNSLTNPFLADQDLFAEDGSYFKINQITLGYTFLNFGFMKRWGLHLLRAYATLYNVGIFSPYSGPDPETVTTLGRDDIKGYPAARSLTLGINAQF